MRHAGRSRHGPVLASHARAAPRDAQGSITRFQTDPLCRVLLTQIGVGARGLTLTCATTVYLLEPCRRVADEAQAMGRVHRIGQTRPTRCVVLFAAGTVEERQLRHRAQTRAGTHDAPAVAVDLASMEDAKAQEEMAEADAAVAAGGGSTAATLVNERSWMDALLDLAPTNTVH